MGGVLSSQGICSLGKERTLESASEGEHGGESVGSNEAKQGLIVKYTMQVNKD